MVLGSQPGTTEEGWIVGGKAKGGRSALVTSFGECTRWSSEKEPGHSETLVARRGCSVDGMPPET